MNSAARRLGLCAGQRLAEASAGVAHLVVQQVSRTELQKTLSRVAELGLAFGTPVSFSAPGPLSSVGYVPDTVWIDITGSSHLWGGEMQLLAELEGIIRALGHRVRGVVSIGPLLAQALARWSFQSRSERVSAQPFMAAGVHEEKILKALPVAALPLAKERIEWLTKLGIHSWGDLRALPRSAATSRLGDHAVQILDLCHGVDPAPLVPYQPPVALVEEATFDQPMVGLQPLLLAVRRLATCLAARLTGRGQAALRLLLRLEHDSAIARQRELSAWVELRFELPTPLALADDLFRVVQARLERHPLLAPTVRLMLEAPVITSAPTRQLDLSHADSSLAGRAPKEALSVVLAELEADLGPQRVGILRTVDTHRPEGQSVLMTAWAPSPSALPASWVPSPGVNSEYSTPTRMLTNPLPVNSALRLQAPVRLDEQIFSIIRIEFEERLEGVEWWSKTATSRDYFRIWLRNSEGIVEALAYLDKPSRAHFLQALVD
ncbi:hypothetical protein ACFL5O_02020 [Myxococcota bacterium]